MELIVNEILGHICRCPILIQFYTMNEHNILGFWSISMNNMFFYRDIFLNSNEGNNKTSITKERYNINAM